MSRVVRIAAVVMFAAVSLGQGVRQNVATVQVGPKAIGTERSHELPSEITSFAQSGDGNVVWVACRSNPPSRHVGDTAAETRKNEQTQPSSPYESADKTTVYALQVQSGQITKLVDAQGTVEIVPAPVGSQTVLVLQQERSNGRAILYDSARRIADLPIDPYLVVWGADAGRIYFYGGTTTQADAWNILGLLRISDLAVSRKRLLEPTESLHVCAKTRHLFTGDPVPDSQGKLIANTVEYDADLRSSRRITKFPPGRFSATCRYVATEQSFHGPLPWEIVEVATGRQLMRFDFTGTGQKDEFEFHSWNPRRDDIVLRVLDPATRFETGVPQRVLQVFDLRQRRVLKSFSNFSGQVAWSRNGKKLVFSRGNSLVFHPIFM